MINSQINKTASTLLWLALWSSLVITFGIFLPGFSEFDTSKYLTITHQMINQHQYILAYWQGHLYSDKPPLFFWLIIAGWKLFGVSNWWPQTIVMTFATFSIFITQRLAANLWPREKSIYLTLPFILIGCFYWVWFAKQIRVDAILVFATVLSLYAIVKSIRSSKRYLILYIAALGLGGFAKGPVILVFVLLPALFMPTILNPEQEFSPKWYGYLGLSTIIGLCIPLAWAIPAAIQGGKAFTEEIFYQQIAHRAHQHQTSALFYISRLPLWLLPWSIYPPTWKGIKTLKLFRPMSADTTCLIILVCGIIAFSAFGQKLPHYLYPLFPFFALLIARLCSTSASCRLWHQWPTAIIVFALGVFCILLPHLTHLLPLTVYIRGYFLQSIHLSYWGGGLLILALTLFCFKPKTQYQQIIMICVAFIAASAFINDSVLFQYQKHINNKALISALKNKPDSTPLVVAGNITDETLNQMINQASLKHISTKRLTQWQQTHPTGWVIAVGLEHQYSAIKDIWFYQSRFSIVTLHKGTSLGKTDTNQR